MKKFLPIIFSILLYCAALISPNTIKAQTPTPAGGYWVVDPEVTFIGKNAARSGNVLNWTLQNYQWVCVTKVAQRNCDNTGNPLQQFWGTVVLWIVMPLLILVILATSMVIIITRGRSLTIMRFVPRFIAVLILIVLSYALLQFLYQFFDMIQGFFLRSGTDTCPPKCISNEHLLYVGWNYEDFVGLRMLGDPNAESAFISLLLTKLTALTYFVMVGILLIRKVILWFFIIISPVFPLLLLFYPIRNTGKIWIGEFFRWLLYGPIFAIFLQGLVFMWRWKGVGGGGAGIPLQFTPEKGKIGTDVIYPTAVNILLGGPQQNVSLTNSINLTETFMLYVIALIMLWIVILLPWVLLQIFLDYASTFAGDNATMKTLVNLVSNKMVPPPSPNGHPPVAPQPAGIALNLPFTKRTVNIPIKPMPTGAAKEIIREQHEIGASKTLSLPLGQARAEVMSFADIPLPTIRDVARYEAALLSNNAEQRQEVFRIQHALEKIANPIIVTSTVEREKFVQMNERLEKENKQGNIIAATILNAVKSAANNDSRRIVQISNSELKNILQQVASPASVSNVVDRERMTKLHEMLTRESKENNSQLASSILSVTNQSNANEIEKIREKLIQAKEQGNLMNATTLSAITNAINTSASQSQSVTQIRTILQQIANPASIANTTEKEKYSKLHDMLTKESKEKNNELASSILQVKDTTSLQELEKITDKLEQSKESAIASQVLSAISDNIRDSQTSTKVKSVLEQIANPATASAVDKEKINSLHEALTKESQKGNQLASSILSVSSQTSASDIRKLQEKLREAKEKGQPFATNILDVASKQDTIDIPQSNRLQAVTPQELQEVRQMWKENYASMEVPVGMAGTRSEWIKDDIEKITSLTSLLTSDDQEKVNQGLSEVGNILPFLLVGGFSKDEIISYLQAKQDAAKEVLESITLEEETKLTVETKKEEAAATMAARIETPTVSMPAPSFETTTIVTPQVSNEILTMVNLKIPRMTDIARFETMTLSHDKSRAQEVQNVRETLERIANPSKIQMPLEREKIEHLKERLIEESQKGNSTAELILIAASAFDQKLNEISATTAEIKTVLHQIASPDFAPEDDREFYVRLHEYLLKESKENNNELARKIITTTEETGASDIESTKSQLIKEQKENKVASQVLNAVNRHVELKQMKNMFSQIADPASITSPANKEHFNNLHEQLLNASNEGSNLASSILDVKQTSKITEIEKLKKDLADAKQKNDRLARAVLSAMSSPIVPPDSKVQEVTEKDYEEIRKMWEENYRTLPLPPGFTDDKKGRIEWIDKDVEEISTTISLLTDTEPEKKNEGLNKVGTILPFLLLGGFSYHEIITYLKIKLEAARTVSAELKSSEEKEEKIDVKANSPKEEKTLKAENEEN